MTIASSLGTYVLGTIRRHGMLRGGERVLAAVSGGPDSVALLDVLAELRASLGLVVRALQISSSVLTRGSFVSPLSRR